MKIRGRLIRGLVSWTTAVVTAGAVLVGLAVVVGGRSAPAAAPSTMVGRPAPSLRGTTVTGSPYTLHAASGHVTVVSIWASWCAPCGEEITLIARVAASFRSRGVRFVTIDTRDDPGAGRTLLTNADAQRLIAVNDASGLLAVSWGATDVPETVLVDTLGIVRARRLGEVSRTWLERQVRRWTTTP